MEWLDTHQVNIGNTNISYASLIVALSIVIAGFFLASRITARIRTFGGEAASAGGWRAWTAQSVGYALRFMSVAAAMQVTGIHVATILAAGAVLAVGIGIAMQKVAENFVSGIILFAERSIREDDIIEFEGRIAKVQHVGIRATIALTLDDEEIIVPNSVLAQSAVKNLTLSESLYRLRVQVGVAYSADVDQVIAVLTKAAESITWRERKRAPVILLLNFGPSSIDFDVSIWTRDVWGLRRGQSELRRAVWRALRDAEITIPFTQMDVRLIQDPEARAAAVKLNARAEAVEAVAPLE